MEREVSSVVTFGVTMVGMAAVLWLVIYTVIIGNDLKVDVINKVVTVQTQVETGQLSALESEGLTIIPRASIYNIVARERAAVGVISINGEEFTPQGNGRWASSPTSDNQFIFPDDILLQNLDGRVKIKVTELSADNYLIALQDLT